VPRCLVRKLSNKLGPCDIVYCASEAPVLHHVPHTKRLEADRLVFTDQPRRELVQRVLPAVADAGVDPGDSISLFLVVPTCLLLSRKPALFAAESKEALFQEAGIAVLLTVTRHDGVGKTDVDTDGSV